MTIYMYIALMAWLCLAFGFAKRKDRSVHIPFVLLGITLDFLLVLYLQVTRDAVGTALQFKLNIFQQIHIGFSTAALLLYFPVLYLGFRLVKRIATPAQRALHIKIAITALILRTFGVLFMFSMWKA